MIGHKVEVVRGSPWRHTVECSCCKRGCAGSGWCLGDALAALPCNSYQRFKKAGVEFPPDWKEVIARDFKRYDLL